jgi:hypothetical protein
MLSLLLRQLAMQISKERDDVISEMLRLENLGVVVSTGRLYFEDDGLLKDRRAVLDEIVSHTAAVATALMASVQITPNSRRVAQQAALMQLITSPRSVR